MPNTFYPKAKEAFVTKQIDWVNDTIKAVLVDVDAGYAYSTTHQFLSDIPSGARISTTAAFTTKTATNGVLDADDTVFSNVTGATSEAVVIYKDTGTAGTSNLILYLDGKIQITIAQSTTNSTNVPVDPVATAVSGSTTLTRKTGTGPATITLSAAAINAGDRALTSTTAISVVAGDVYEVQVPSSKLPITPNGGNLNVAWDNGANKIAAL